jgi:hypothetical protein
MVGTCSSYTRDRPFHVRASVDAASAGLGMLSRPAGVQSGVFGRTMSTSTSLLSEAASTKRLTTEYALQPLLQSFPIPLVDTFRSLSPTPDHRAHKFDGSADLPVPAAFLKATIGSEHLPYRPHPLTERRPAVSYADPVITSGSLKAMPPSMCAGTSRVFASTCSEPLEAAGFRTSRTFDDEVYKSETTHSSRSDISSSFSRIVAPFGGCSSSTTSSLAWLSLSPVASNFNLVNSTYARARGEDEQIIDSSLFHLGHDQARID